MVKKHSGNVDKSKMSALAYLLTSEKVNEVELNSLSFKLLWSKEKAVVL